MRKNDRKIDQEILILAKKITSNNKMAYNRDVDEIGSDK